METLKQKRQAELQQKELLEQEQLAKNQLHRPGQKLDLNDFKRTYAEKMEQMHTKKQAKKETITRQQEGGNTFQPAINKYSRKIAEAGGIANVKQKQPALMPNNRAHQLAGVTADVSTRASVFSDTQPIISAALIAGPVLESKEQASSPIKSSLQRL